MKIKDILISVSNENPFMETCGFIINEDGEFNYLPQKNSAPNPNEMFHIPAINFLNAKQKYNLVAIFHNHLIEDPKPSKFDQSVAEITCYPMVIYSNLTKNFHIYEPKWMDVDVNILEGLRNSLL